MKTIFEIKRGTHYYYVADENGNQVEETASFSDTDWARVELLKQAYKYMEKEALEADKFGVTTNMRLEVKDDKVVRL